ncbi:MAG: type IV secretory system conjugative DNA transfer family protein [Acetobacteraceae bacterium]
MMERERKLYLAVLGFGVLAALIAASQYVGFAYGYDPRLGWSVGQIAGITLYVPIAFPVWLLTIARTGPTVFDTAGLIFVGAMFVPFLLAVMLTRCGQREVRQFGSRAWGTLADAHRAGLIHRKPIGTIVGWWSDRRRLLSYQGPEHQLVAGAARSGKGAGHVIPTLLSWPESVLVYDPKAECFDITATFRSKFSHAFFLNFTRRDSACFNPLAEVRRGDFEIADVQNVAAILCDPAGTKNQTNFFDDEAVSLLTAVILHVLYTAPDDRKSLATVRNRLMDFEPLLEEMATTLHRNRPDPAQADGRARDANGNPIPEGIGEVVLTAKEFLAMPARLRGDVRATAMSYLKVFADTIVADKTSRSDFRIGKLMCAESPVSCYLQVPPSDARRLRPLTRLFLSQVAASLMKDMSRDAEGRAKKHKLLFLIDEFPTLGRLGFFSDNLRLMAGYGIKAMLIVQSFKDIADAYGTNNTIIDNCHVTVAFATADNDTARKISEMAGLATEYRASESRSSGGSGLFTGRFTRSFSEAKRELLDAGDVRRLPYDEQLVFVTGAKPFRTRKVRYWKDAPFKGRATDIAAGERGPDQVARPDVPDAGRVASPWTGVQAVGHTGSVVRADLPVDDAEPAENAGALAVGIGEDLDGLLGEERRRGDLAC